MSCSAVETNSNTYTIFSTIFCKVVLSITGLREYKDTFRKDNVEGRKRTINFVYYIFQCSGLDKR